MNLFIREIKAHQKSLIIWSVIIGVFMYLSMAKYATLATDAKASQQLLEAFPSTIQAVFGMTGLDLTTMIGYYGTCFIFLAVMLAIHAGMLGSELIAKEEIDKTAEFLYVKPISRARALTLKSLAGIVIMVTLYIVTFVVSYHGIALVNGGEVPLKELAIFSVALAIIQSTFFSIGVLAATALGKPKKAAALTAGIVLVTYIAHVLQSMSPNFSWLKNVSPFAYFNAQDVLASQGINVWYAYICVVVTLASMAYGYIAFVRRDFKV